MKRIICLILSLIMIIPSGLNVFAANDVAWPARSDTGMPYRPFDNYLSMNNPPSFSWPCVEGSEYELRISTDPEFETVNYEKSGIKFNVYNFNKKFETDTKYYWQVRYKLNGNTSVWSQAREFMISTDAYDNRFPEITLDFLNGTIGNKARPRLLLDDDLKTFLKDLKDKGTTYLRSGSALIISATILKCSASAKDEPPNFTTLRLI